MKEFRIRPAPLRAEQSFVLDQDRLIGPGWSLDLNNLTGLAFVSYRAYGRMIWRLDLLTGEDTRRINANLPTPGAAETEDFQSFLALTCALIDIRLAQVPDLCVSFGERGIARSIMFGIGVLSALAGAIIGLAALSGGRAAAAAMPVLLLILFGGFVIRSSAPWSKPPKVDARVLPDLLTYLAKGQNPP